MLAVELPRRAAGAASRALWALGAQGVQEDLPPGVAAEFRQPWDTGPRPPPPARVLLRAWFAAQPPDGGVGRAVGGREVSWQVQEERDWGQEWKRSFEPIRVSPRLVVAAPWHGIEDALVIEPGLAFGTGEHPTTRACLRAIDAYARPGGSILDVGCGSGVLALAGAKLGMRARGIDIDPDSVRSSREAATRNGLAAEFDDTPLARVEGPFDLVVANLFAEVIVALAPDLRRACAGTLVLAGILDERAGAVRAALYGLPVLDDRSESGWTSLVLRCPA